MGMKEMLSSAETQNAGSLKECVFHRLDASISEPELGEKQDTIPARQKSPNCFSFMHVAKKFISDLWFFSAQSPRPLKTMRFGTCRKKDKKTASLLLSFPVAGSPQWPCWEQIAV